MSGATTDWVVIALGANLANAAEQVREAARRLHAWAAAPFLTSSVWSSTPEECPPGSPRFANAVVAFPVSERWTPETLLEALQALERDMGRTPKRVLNEARLVDLDLIAFGRERRETARLVLPHPRAVTRQFVMEPLAEILPAFRAPGWPGTAKECLASVRADPAFARIGPIALAA